MAVLILSSSEISLSLSIALGSLIIASMASLTSLSKATFNYYSSNLDLSIPSHKPAIYSVVCVFGGFSNSVS